MFAMSVSNFVMIPSSLTLYRAYIINPISFNEVEACQDGGLVIDDYGQIYDIGEFKQFESSQYVFAKIYDWRDKVIIPGFIDLHVHLPQINIVGLCGKNLLDWLETYTFKAEAKMRDLHYAQNITNYFYDELLKNGTTCALVFSSSHYEATRQAFNIAKARQMRIIMGQVLMDINAPADLINPVRQSLNESCKLSEAFHGANDNLLQYAFTPRFAITSSAALLKETGKLYQESKTCYLQTHLAESINEINFVKQLYPHNSSYTDIYDSNMLLGKRSVFAHAIHLDDYELDTLKQSQSSLAHCPSSNFFLKSGTFAFKKIQALNLAFGLGSDIAGGPDISIANTMKDAYYAQMNEFISPVELFYLATLAGAQALSLEQQIGSFAALKHADFLVLRNNLQPDISEKLHNMSPEEILSKLIFTKNSFSVEKTFVRGQCLYDKTNKKSQYVL